MHSFFIIRSLQTITKLLKIMYLYESYFLKKKKIQWFYLFHKYNFKDIMNSLKCFKKRRLLILSYIPYM